MRGSTPTRAMLRGIAPGRIVTNPDSPPPKVPLSRAMSPCVPGRALCQSVSQQAAASSASKTGHRARPTMEARSPDSPGEGAACGTGEQPR